MLQEFTSKIKNELKAADNNNPNPHNPKILNSPKIAWPRRYLNDKPLFVIYTYRI